MESSDSNLQAVLPNTYPYLVVESDFTSEEKFSCALRIKIKNEEEFLQWLSEFESISNTNWNFRRSKAESNRFLYSRDYVCHHSNYNKVQDTLSSKNKDCRAKLTVRIKRNTKDVRYKDKYAKEGYLSIINVNFVHSHAVNDEESWHWLRRAPNVKDRFLDYFTDGLSPSAAIIFHEDSILSEMPDKVKNSRENPPKRWVYTMHHKLLKEFEELTGENLSALTRAEQREKLRELKLLRKDFEASNLCPKHSTSECGGTSTTPIVINFSKDLNQEKFTSNPLVIKLIDEINVSTLEQENTEASDQSES